MGKTSEEATRIKKKILRKKTVRGKEKWVSEFVAEVAMYECVRFHCIWTQFLLLSWCTDT